MLINPNHMLFLEFLEEEKNKRKRDQSEREQLLLYPWRLKNLPITITLNFFFNILYLYDIIGTPPLNSLLIYWNI